MKNVREQGEKLLTKLYEAAGTAPMIELHGTGELMLSGCLSITDYGKEKIVARTSLGTVSICGSGLVMSVYRGDILSIEGKINLISIGGDESAS